MLPFPHTGASESNKSITTACVSLQSKCFPQINGNVAIPKSFRSLVLRLLWIPFFLFLRLMTDRKSFEELETPGIFSRAMN